MVFLLSAFQVNAQETLVVGQVFNKFDRTPLESVSISFKGSTIHTQTNEDGYFLIRNEGKESVLVFSLIGFKKEEIRLKPGESVGIEVLLEEQENILNEILVRPGVNPAHDLMRKVRENRKTNNIRINLKSNEQSVVLLSKNDSRWQNNRLFQQFKSGNLSENDSVLLVPLYMEESVYNQTDKSKHQISRNTYNTSETAQNTISTLLNGLNTDINFYNNSISILGKNMISPLANIGRTYYRYYLIDSVQTNFGKEYLLNFRSKNTKNLAFNGELRIDSGSYALTYISAELPRQANLNFIHNLQISQSFDKIESYWIPNTEKSAWNMTYDLLKEADSKLPELMISKKTVFSPDENLICRLDSFAVTNYSEQEIEAKMAQMQQSPLYKTASYLADVMLTGYFRVGKFDIGQIVNIVRLTDVEGFRAALPLRTNERLWKNFMLGGHAAYGLRDKEIKYSAFSQWRLPISQTNIVVGVKYLDDYRRIDYDYNNFLWREDPMATGDEDFSSTILQLKSQNRMSKRKEITAFLQNDWTDDIESKWIFRDVTYFANELLPLEQNSTTEFSSLNDRNFSFTTRFSFGERVLDKHFQRLYLKSYKPVIYVTADGGQFHFGDKKGTYGRLNGTFLQNGQFTLGEWRLMLEGGKIFGNVPYPLLKFVQGREGGVYNRYEFSLMKNREYIANTYATLFSEVILNGVLLNNIPVIKHLNLREIASFKMAYGTLSAEHSALMNIPAPSEKFTLPYSEVSVGICNLLGFGSIQSIWRLTDLAKPNIQKWGIKFNIMVTF
ncbi:MAG: carboxypeptidase-like regulatory domain-containing protein [Porphyromonadaceae bacterium]|nr:carboxypeptidase-like regulatory domain-containing protein [Porphyromonadaceae bacterium]